MRLLSVLLALLAPSGLCFAHGGSYQPPPGVWPTPPLPPPPDVPVPTPPDSPPDPRPPDTRPEVPRPTVTGRRGRAPNTWRTWWELNREHLIGLRKLLRQRGPVTPRPASEERVDPLLEHRAEVLGALRNIARRAGDRTLRAAAVIALGRMGNDADVLRLLELLQDKRQPKDVQEAAAVALGIASIEETATRAAVREYLQGLIRKPSALPTRARGLALLSTGLRAREDSSLVMSLVGCMVSRKKTKAEDTANLVYACGLARHPMVVPELIPALRKSTLGGRKIGDLTRAHAALALGLSGDRNAARILATVLGARSTQQQTRRSAALALGRLLRETELKRNDVAAAERALLVAFEKGSDYVLRGFAAVALGGARRPLARLQLMTAIDHGGNAAIKPFCALGLGLAARTLGDDGGRKIRSFLLEELGKTRAIEQASALAIALGVARADKATRELMMLLTKKSRNVALRGAAAQGLGLLGSKDPDAHRTLEEIALREKSPDLLENVVLALGMMGRRSIASKLVKMLRTSKSTRLQGRIILALGHLDHGAAVDPLLTILTNDAERPLVREFAAVALGIMGDRRDQDLLFSLDAHFNYLATSIASHELIRLY